LELELPDDPLLSEIPALLTPIQEQQKENLPQNGSVSCLQKAYDITKYKVKKATTKRSSDGISATAAAAEVKDKVFETMSRPVGKIPLKSKQISDEHGSDEFLPCKKKSVPDDSHVKPRSQVKKFRSKGVDRRNMTIVVTLLHLYLHLGTSDRIDAVFHHFRIRCVSTLRHNGDGRCTEDGSATFVTEPNDVSS